MKSRSQFFRIVRQVLAGIALYSLTSPPISNRIFAETLPESVGPQSEVPIGLYVSATGDKAAFGINQTNGVHMAVDQLNANGGVLHGHPLKLTIEDDQSRPGQPAAAVRKLISNDHVVAIIGEFTSSLSLEAAPIAQAAKIPMISPGSTSPNLTQKGEYIFRNGFLDTFQGVVMAKFALETLKLKKIAFLIAINQDHSVSVGKTFRDYFIHHGGEVILEKDYNTGEKDFKGPLTAIRAVKPDAIFAPGFYTEAGLIARQARSLGIKVPLLSCDGWDSPKLIALGGSAMNGTYFSTHFSPENMTPKSKEFTEAYEARYHTTPDSSAVLGYDAVMMLADAINRAGTTEHEALRKALAETKNFPAVTGNITLDAGRNPAKSAVIVEVRDNKFHYVTTVQP